MRPVEECPRCGRPLDTRGSCVWCVKGSGSRSKTVALPRKELVAALPSPEAAGDELAEVPIPEGWEIALDAVAGPNDGTHFRITRSRVLIGRGKVEVSLADPKISRRHASLEVYGGTCVLLKDLGSTNGTFVNDAPVYFVELEDGDEIRLGSSRLTVTIAVRTG